MLKNHMKYRNQFLALFILIILPATGILLSHCSKDNPVDTPPGETGPVPENVSFAFINTNVVPMDVEGIIENQTVIIRDGNISEIVPAGTYSFPDTIPQIDGSGRYLMPGLADMHAHLTNADQSKNDLLLYIANGVTTIRLMWGFTRYLNWRDQVENGTLIGPRIYSASPGFEGRSTGFSGSVLFNTPEQARQAVIIQKNRGFDFIKMFNGLTLAEYRAITEEAQAQDIKVIGHVPFAFNIDQVVASPVPQDCIEHLRGYARLATSTGSWATGTINETTLMRLAEDTRDAGIWHCPTITVDSRMRSQVPGLSNVPELRFVSPALLNWLQQPVTQPPNFDSRVSDTNRKRAVKIFHDAGVRLLLGTDGAFFWVLPGFGIHEELANFVDAGLTPFQALKTSTVNAADFLETSDQTGSVTVGKQADLILLDGNPLQGVANLKQRAGVMVRGQWFSEETLQEMLEQLARSYGN